MTQSLIAQQQLRRYLACPTCHGDLRGFDTLSCDPCGVSFETRDGIPILLDSASTTMLSEARSNAENVRLRNQLRRNPRLLRLVDALRPPHPFAYMRWRVSRKCRADFSRLIPKDSEQTFILDIGSGILGGANAKGLSPFVRAHIVPLEIAPTSGIGVVGDAHKLPLQSDCVDGVLIQGVLEHVIDPDMVVGEILRVLKPGAPVLAEVPFIQHFHLDPIDLRRFTLSGVEQLFRSFDTIESGVCAGPASALTDMVTEFFSLPFRSTWLYWSVKTLVGWLVCPFQLLDEFWIRPVRAHTLAGAVYFVGSRPPLP